MRKSRPSQPASQETNDIHPQARQMRRKPLAARRPDTRSAHQGQRRQMLGPGLAIIAGRTAGAVSRRLHLGGGTSIAGMVARRIYPNIIGHLAQQLEHGSILVTGTNGKTTTSSLIATILNDSGLRVWNNREGSNLMRGIATALVIRALPNGNLRLSGRAISIMEVDEAVVPQIVKEISPRVMVFSNLFRDQLDRYGEVDSVIGHWKRAISLLPATTTLVLNADDPAIANLGHGFAGRIVYYGVEDLSLSLQDQGTEEQHHQVVDARTCPNCGSDYIYDARFYSHMGHYHCPSCGQHRPQPDVRITHVQPDSFDRWQVQVSTDTDQHDLVIPLPGFYNVYNALAATSAALALEVPWEPISNGIAQFQPVFGRGERVEADGRTIRLLLAKNPTGFNEVLRTLFSDEQKKHVLFILNDNTADGHDISWIWDVDFERAVGRTASFNVAGIRALDLALRLKYAGMAQEEMTIVPAEPLRSIRQKGTTQERKTKESKHAQVTAVSELSEALPLARAYGLKQALDSSLSQTPVGETLFIVPTYTGLLAMHRELEQRGWTAHYWEGKDE